MPYLIHKHGSTMHATWPHCTSANRRCGRQQIDDLYMSTSANRLSEPQQINDLYHSMTAKPRRECNDSLGLPGHRKDLYPGGHPILRHQCGRVTCPPRGKCPLDILYLCTMSFQTFCTRANCHPPRVKCPPLPPPQYFLVG